MRGPLNRGHLKFPMKSEPQVDKTPHHETNNDNLHSFQTWQYRLRRGKTRQRPGSVIDDELARQTSQTSIRPCDPIAESEGAEWYNTKHINKYIHKTKSEGADW